MGHAVYSTKETQRNSYDMGIHVVRNNIPGDIVECGIAAGANLATMILGCMYAGGQKTAWGFDSFEGIEMAGPRDFEQPGIGGPHKNAPPHDGEIKSSGVTAIDEPTVRMLFDRWALTDYPVRLVKGWVQNTIPHQSLTQIAILRLDMDVYEPTRHALIHLYPLVSPGGVIIIDDWVLDGCRAACEEYFSEHGITPELKTIPGSGPVYFFKPAER